MSDKDYEDFKRSIIEFLWSEVEPLNPKIESTHHVPHECLFPKFREKGLFGLIIPKKYGGSELSISQYLPILTEISKVNGAVRGIIHVHNTSARAIDVFGTEEQKNELLPKQATGESSIAFGLTEANAGTGIDIKTRAVRDGNLYVLSGEKHLITNADFADLFMIACYTNRDMGHRGLSALLVMRDTPGFTIEEMPHIMGCRGLGHGILNFQECTVPVTNVVGKEGMGLEIFLGELEASRVFVAASSLGTAERALEEAIKYAKERITFGKPIAKREMIRAYLADMAMDVYALRLMLEDVGRKLDAGKECTLECSITKLFGLETVCRVTDKGMLVFGGRSYLEGYPIERLFRDARLNVLEEGTPSIQRMVIARSLFENYSE